MTCLIPNPPFTYTTSYEAYRFQPISLIDIPKDILESSTYVYVTPYIQLRGNKLEEVVATWVTQQRTKPHAKFTIIKKQELTIKHYPAYYLEDTSPGYDDNRFANKTYIEQDYFLQSPTGQVACFRLVRLDKEDKKTYLLEQWKESMSKSFILKILLS